METDGDGTNSAENLNSTETSSTKPFRIKTYPSSFNGPFAVYFRKKEKPINDLLISAEIYKRFKSVKEIKKISLDKLRIIFGSRDDANSLLESKLFCELYRVYAPSDSCEINGIIYDEDLNCDDVINHGSGVFKNKSISPVKILDCMRLSKQYFTDKESFYKHSNCIKITFAGSVLPDNVIVNNVVFNVRLYFPKIMHCEHCLLFGHTSQFCSNKPKCSKCGEAHSSADCNKHSDFCIYCSKKHNSLKDCSVYITHQQRLNQKIKNKNKLSYSEVMQTTPSVSTANMFTPLADVVVEEDQNAQNNYVYKPPIKRKKTFKSSINFDDHLNPQASTSYESHFPPLKSPMSPRIIPGFQKIDPENSTKSNPNNNDNSDSGNSILSILEDFVEILGLSDFWKTLIKKILPFLVSILEKLNSFGPLISALFSS